MEGPMKLKNGISTAEALRRAALLSELLRKNLGRSVVPSPKQ
jgi:hypothetical protein